MFFFMIYCLFLLRAMLSGNTDAVIGLKYKSDFSKKVILYRYVLLEKLPEPVSFLQGFIARLHLTINPCRLASFHWSKSGYSTSVHYCLLMMLLGIDRNARKKHRLHSHQHFVQFTGDLAILVYDA